MCSININVGPSLTFDPSECLTCRLLWTHLATLPFDFSGLGNRIPTFVDVELFGEGFVLKVGILVKVLREKHTAVSVSVREVNKKRVKLPTHKVYSVS